MKKRNRSFLLGCLLLVAGLGLTSCTVNVAGDLNVNVDTGDITVDTTVDDNPSGSVDDDGKSDNTDNTDSTDNTGNNDDNTEDGDDGSATPTPDPDPVTYSISFKSSSYEFEIDETLNLGGEITCTASDGSTASYTLSVDNTNFSVINLNHTVSATQAGTATLTATCDQDTSVTATAQITATDLPEPEPELEPDPDDDPEPEVSTTYKIGAYDEYNGSYYYLTNTNSGNYVSATTSWSSAADFTVTDTGDGYTLSTDKNGTTYYVYFNTSSTTSSNLSISTTSFTWLYDSDNNTFLTASSSGRFIAKRASASDMRCYSVTNINKTTGTDSTELYYAVHLYATEGVIAQPGTDNPGDTGGSGDKSYTRTYTLDSSNSLPSDITSYSTGGFATETFNSYEFDIYRGASLSNYFVKILAELGNANTASSMPGMLMNTTGFNDIAMIELTYKTATNSYKQKTQEVPHIYYGSTNAYEYTYDLSTSNNDKTITIETEGTDIQFFCLSTSYYDVSIKSLTIYYNSGSASSYTTSSCGEGQYRIEPVRFSGTPVANSSTVRVPIDVTYNTNGTYTVNEYRTLTYDTYDSAYSAKRTTNAYTDPVDVAAYYVAFGTYPCNYTTTSNYSTAYSVFGASTRFYSYYTRTNGYATSVPYRTASYYELDIAMTSNYTKSSSSYSRGVGRLVCWTNGFAGYDTYPVVTYTDDHYHTFKEYYNDGTFGLNFNAEGKATRYTYGYPTTATAS